MIRAEEPSRSSRNSKMHQCHFPFGSSPFFPRSESGKARPSVERCQGRMEVTEVGGLRRTY